MNWHFHEIRKHGKDKRLLACPSILRILNLLNSYGVKLKLESLSLSRPLTVYYLA